MADLRTRRSLCCGEELRSTALRRRFAVLGSIGRCSSSVHTSHCIMVRLHYSRHVPPRMCLRFSLTVCLSINLSLTLRYLSLNISLTHKWKYDSLRVSLRSPHTRLGSKISPKSTSIPETYNEKKSLKKMDANRGTTRKKHTR